MLSSSWRRAAGIVVGLLAASAFPSRAGAQQQPQGFAVERFYPSAPDGGWFVMDSLDMHGGLGGAMALTTGYAMKPLRVSDGSRDLAVVSDEAFADFGFAATYDRWRLYLNADMPLLIKGESSDKNCTRCTYAFTAPSVDLGSNPDTLTDPRIGLDARLLGDPRGRFRLGLGAQLFFPNVHSGITPPNPRLDYDTDGTFRAMGRVLFAGDFGAFTYAGHLGVHIRPLDDGPTPGSPRGSEMLFGVAGGGRFPVGPGGGTALVIGPEIYGETAFRSFLATGATGLEALLTGRLEGTSDDAAQLRVKLGTGGGIDPNFGAPEWRIVFGIELFDHSVRAPAPQAGGPLGR